MNILVLLAILGIIVASFYSGFSVARDKYKQEEPETLEETDIIQVGTESYEVTRRERKPKWKERRRELEARERTKRQKLEEWRD